MCSVSGGMYSPSLDRLNVVDLPIPDTADTAPVVGTHQRGSGLHVQNIAPVPFPGYLTHAGRARQPAGLGCGPETDRVASHRVLDKLVVLSSLVSLAQEVVSGSREQVPAQASVSLA